MKIKNEFEFKQWFRKNYKKLGFSEIIRDDIKTCPDFIMLKGNKKVNVELETLASNFIVHNHPLVKVDQVVCLVKDVDIGIPIREIKGLKFQGIGRISATIDKDKIEFLKHLVKKKKYRNASHAIETAIELLEREEGSK